jgi:hypothetical protein
MFLNICCMSPQRMCPVPGAWPVHVVRDSNSCCRGCKHQRGAGEWHGEACDAILSFPMLAGCDSDAVVPLVTHDLAPMTILTKLRLHLCCCCKAEEERVEPVVQPGTHLEERGDGSMYTSSFSCMLAACLMLPGCDGDAVVPLVTHDPAPITILTKLQLHLCCCCQAQEEQGEPVVKLGTHLAERGDGSMYHCCRPTVGMRPCKHSSRPVL